MGKKRFKRFVRILTGMNESGYFADLELNPKQNQPSCVNPPFDLPPETL